MNASRVLTQVRRVSWSRLARAAVFGGGWLLLALSGCGAARTASPAPEVAPADVTFIRGMIVHHNQALAMVALVQERSEREDIRILARRIGISQRDEIELLREWLASRRLSEGDDGSTWGSGPEDHLTHLSGMLAEQDLSNLAAGRGREFDRLFLELMIRHHEGALRMVEALFAAERAAQEAEIFGMASRIDADQRAEILRMQAMLQPPR